MLRGDNLRKLAVQNLKDRRQRQKHSEIFGAQQAAKPQETEEAQAASSDRIDLTQSQLSNEQDDSTNQIDEFDLLEAKVDPKDVRTQ